MIPIRDERGRGPFPWVTVTILVLLAVIYVWDRGWSLVGQPFVFSDLAARPKDIVAAFRGGSREPFVTLFTSVFLHANLGHIIANVIFLYAFGPRVEHAFGPWR